MIILISMWKLVFIFKSLVTPYKDILCMVMGNHYKISIFKFYNLSLARLRDMQIIFPIMRQVLER